MRHWKILILMLTAGCVMASAAVAQDAETLDKIRSSFPKLNQIDLPDVERITLDNGMRLYILEDHELPLFNASVRMNCGSYVEPAEQVGLASICGTVMRTGGTEKWSGDELDEVLEGVGATVETYIDLTAGGAYINCLSDYHDLGLEVLAEVLRRPRFDEDKIELAKVDERTNISRRNDEVPDIALREWRKLVYGPESPYARHTEYATIDAVDRESLIEFHKTWIRPENIQLAVWGDFDKETIKAKIGEYFGDWERGQVELPAYPEVNYEWRSKVYYAPKEDAAQTTVRVGHLGGLVADEDYTDRIVMNSVLGLGFGSRIVDNVRTKLGLAYSTGGRYVSNYNYPGYFFVMAMTGHDNTLQATREMIKQIRSMQTDPPTQTEMERGKDGYLNSFVFNFDSKREIMNRIMEYDRYGMPEDFLQQEKAGVEKVTPEAVMAAAQRNLRPDDMIVLVVGKGSEFDGSLEELGLGPVDTIDITIPSGEPAEELAITPENLERGIQLVRAGAEAAGGVAKFKNLKAVESKGTMLLSMGGQELPISIHSIEMLPDRSRTVMNFMGREIFEIRDRDHGWKTDQMSGELVEMTADDITSADKDLRRNTMWIFANADDPYYRAVYDGDGDVDGVAVAWVAIVDDADEEICRLGFDAGDGHLVCQRYWGESPMGEGMLDRTFADYGEFEGIRLPAQTIVKMNGQQIMKFDVAERTVNGEVGDDAFAKP